MKLSFQLLFFSLWIFSCNGGKSKAEGEQTESAQTTFFKHKVDGLFTIEVPGYLLETEALNSEADLQFFSLKKGIFITIMSETISDTELEKYKDLIDMTDANGDTSQLSYYIQFQIDAMLETISNSDIVLVDSTAINGHQAKFFKTIATDNNSNERVAIRGYAIKNDTRYFYIYLFSSFSKLKKQEKDLDKIVNSFKVIENDTISE